MNKHKEWGIILPMFLVALLLLASLQFFIWQNSKRAIDNFGAYINYLDNSKQKFIEFTELTRANADCQSKQNINICFFPQLNRNISVNFVELLKQGSQQINCSFTANAFGNKLVLSPSSTSSFYYCKNLNQLTSSSNITGNLEQADQYLTSYANQALEIYVHGYLHSKLILNFSNSNRLLAFGDIVIPQLECQIAEGCSLEIMSVTGQIVVQSIIGNINLKAAYRKDIYLPYGYSYTELDLNPLPQIAGLPVSMRQRL